MSPPALPLIALGALCALFGAVYGLARRIDNYGVVDIAWSYAFGPVALLYALCGPGWPVRRALIGALALVWSLRLGTHLLIRVAGHHPVEDGRYQRLRQDWKMGFAGKMAAFFQMQAVSVVFLSAPFLLACLNAAPVLSPLEAAGTALWVLAIAGEALADAQLAAFKRDPTRKEQVCDTGLWRLSRHPNYFCEWLVWVAYALFACASPWGWISLLCPAGILWLLLRVTGIPMTEAQALRSKGEAYRRYQQATSAFLPWFPKRR